MEYMSEEKIRRNLIDAGCDDATISDFFKLTDAGRLRDRNLLLQKHRKKILNKLHERQYQIDCLDYLLIQLENQIN